MIGKLNEKKALSLLMEFLSIEGITGKEKLIAKAVEHSLISFGVPKKFIFFECKLIIELSPFRKSDSFDVL